MKAMETLWTRADRWRRSCGLDDNDMRRDVDRVQWRLGVLLLMVFLCAAPPLSAHAARSVHQSGVRKERYEAATLERAEATIVKAGEAEGRRRVTVSWTAKDGTPRAGDYTTWRGAEVGDRLIVWAGDGTVTNRPPRGRTRTAVLAASAGAGAVLAAGLPPLGLYALLRRRCDRHRYRLWDAGWARFDSRHIGP